MIETITSAYFNVDERWDARALPHFDRSAVIISAWSTDEELDDQADALAAKYSTDADDLHDLLHGVRTHLRAAALGATSPSLVTEAVAVVGNLDHLVTAASTDAELRTLAEAAEAGAGGPVPDLLAELHRLRDAERADRVFVAGAAGVAPQGSQPAWTRTTP